MALRRRQLLRFASALVLRGRDPNSITSLRDIVDIDTVKEGLRFFLDRSGGKPTNAICDIAHALKSVARHYVRVDQTHLDSLAAIVHRLWPDRQGLTEKNRARLRPFDDANNVAALLGLPEKLMALAARARRPRDGALLAQTAAAIETLTLTFAPLRLQNLVGIDCEENLVRSGRGNLLHIVIPARDVKNTEPLECPLPAVSAELIMRYVRDFEVNPHLFRHLNAKLYLDANPGAYEVVRRVLGHRSMQTTASFLHGIGNSGCMPSRRRDDPQFPRGSADKSITSNKLCKALKWAPIPNSTLSDALNRSPIGLRPIAICGPGRLYQATYWRMLALARAIPKDGMWQAARRWHHRRWQITDGVPICPS